MLCSSNGVRSSNQKSNASSLQRMATRLGICRALREFLSAPSARGPRSARSRAGSPGGLTASCVSRCAPSLCSVGRCAVTAPSARYTFLDRTRTRNALGSLHAADPGRAVEKSFTVQLLSDRLLRQVQLRSGRMKNRLSKVGELVGRHCWQRIAHIGSDAVDPPRRPSCHRAAERRIHGSDFVAQGQRADGAPAVVTRGSMARSGQPTGQDCVGASIA